MKSDNFEWLLPAPVQGESWRWGRYVGPLQVEFSPGTITWVTESLVSAEVGQRVLVRFYSGTRATIMGILGGPNPVVMPTPGPNMLPGFPIMNGVRPPGTSEFGLNWEHPSLWLQGTHRQGWIWAQVPITEGERYRFSVDVRATVSGTVFYLETRNAGPGGTRGTGFDSWTDWERSAGVPNWSSGAYPIPNTVAGTGYESYWAEGTATTSGVISLYIWANHTNGATNATGYQWFRNLSIMHLPPDRNDSWRWGTIMSVNPVRVRLDGDSATSSDTPDCLVSVTVGDRVRVQVTSEGMTVFGKLYAGTKGHPGEIVVNGTAYATSGVVSSPGWTVARTDGSIYTGNMDVSQPFAPPSGWTFTWSAQQSTGYTFVSTSNGEPVNGKQTLRVLQVGNNSTTALRLLVWQLVKL